jgi:uroporphyrinogen-III decarboxylase
MADVQKFYFSFQDGVRRFETAMQGLPDRVPVYAQIHDFARKETGVSAREFYTSAKTLVSGTLEIMEKYGIDVPDIDYDVYNIEAEALGQKIIYKNDDTPAIDRSKPLIRDRNDLKHIRTPDFKSDGRLANVIEMYTHFYRLTGTEPVLHFCAPFTLAANIRGIERLVGDIYDTPNFARSLLDRLTEEVLIPWILHLKTAFPNAKGICGSDAMASLPIINPRIVKEWIVPYILRLRQLCDSRIYIPNWVGERHLKKNPESILDLKRLACPWILVGQDPDVETLSPELYKGYAEKHGVPLSLGTGASFLARSAAKEVSERVKRYIEVGGKNGRFALYLCNIGATTPPENVKAAINTLNIYGVYK